MRFQTRILDSWDKLLTRIELAVVKIFKFGDAGFVQSAIQEARKSEYKGVILDFGDKGGGSDSAMTFLAGILGTKFNL